MTGFAALGVTQPRLLLSQYQDSTSLSKTLLMLGKSPLPPPSFILQHCFAHNHFLWTEVYRAQVILLSDTVEGNIRMSLESFAEDLDSDLQEWPRRYFSEV